MIIFQLLAILLLIPFSVVLLLVFNIYSKNWLYGFAISLFALLYTSLVWLAFHSAGVAMGVLILLAILYFIRMKSLNEKLQNKESNRAPFVRGEIKVKKGYFHLVFYFPLFFVKIVKYLPKCLSRELMKHTNSDVGIPKLTDQLLEASVGTRIEINCDEADLHFEIQ